MKQFALVLMVTGSVLALGWQASQGDDDDGEGLSRLWRPSSGVAPVDNPLYAAECSGCHMAYPPGLLPARSWNKLMAGLDEHFGDNAELDPVVHRKISDYLVASSADSSDYRRSRRIMRGLPADQSPVRISDLPYIRHEHDELPARVVRDNPEVRSLSNCDACHQGAQKGSFSEHDIRIPGYGRWDD